MISLNDILKYIDKQIDVYIRFKGDKISQSLEYFKIRNPTNWGLCTVYNVTCDNNDLIIDIYKV